MILVFIDQTNAMTSTLKQKKSEYTIEYYSQQQIIFALYDFLKTKAKKWWKNRAFSEIIYNFVTIKKTGRNELIDLRKRAEFFCLSTRVFL